MIDEKHRSRRVRTGFVLGAGLGTRLRPLTDHHPKPLLPLQGRPIITHIFDALLGAQIERILINTHHLAGCYDEVFPDRQWKGVPLIFRHEPEILDTGGGIANIADLLDPDEELLVHNGDVIHSMDIPALIQTHLSEEAEATLALRTTGGPLHVNLAPSGRVTDIRSALNAPPGTPCLFTGVYLVSPAFRARLLPHTKRSVIPTFLEMIQEGRPPLGVIHDEGQWTDMGTPEEYQALCASQPFWERR